MKKLFLIFVAVISAAVFMDSVGKSMPVVSEKRILRDKASAGTAYGTPEVKVMTYNIHRGINKNGRLDLDGIAEAVKGSGAEIIALQEVERFSFRTGFRDQIKYLADKLSMQYVFGKSINILNGQYGNGLLSIYPIEEYEVIRLYSEGEQRTLLKAVLNVDGTLLRVYNTHLGLSQEERDRQVEDIIKLAAEEENLIITGDFNTKADKLGAIAGKLTDSGGIEPDGEKATFEADGLSGRIDYIFASKNFEIKGYEVLDTEASDHYPVVSILGINN